MGCSANRNRGLEHALRTSAAADLLHGLGLTWAAPALAGLARLVVGRFVDDLQEVDAAISRGGLSAAADVVLTRYAGTVTIRGAQLVPSSGPLVVAANHAGVVDAPAIWRLLAVRDDVLIIALDRPILRAIPHLSSRLLSVGSEAHGRTGLVRGSPTNCDRVVRCSPSPPAPPNPIRSCGWRTHWPRWTPGAWGRTVPRLVPETAVLPVVVSGVISQRMLRNPVARCRSTPEERELAAATLQVLFRDRSINPVVTAGEPLRHAPRWVTSPPRWQNCSGTSSGAPGMGGATAGRLRTRYASCRYWSRRYMKADMASRWTGSHGR